MKVTELKKLEDKEFARAINNMIKNKIQLCTRCGNEITLQNRRILSVTKDNIKVKRLCTICENCYTDMLDNLGISDVDL